jgi:Uncharacterized low-complexity proteins
MTDPPEKFDGEVPETRCGYTYPEDANDDRDPGTVPSRNSCIRKPLSDTDRCGVHADPDATEHKTDRLETTESVGGSLDGALLPGPFADGVEFSDVSLLRDTDLSEADLLGVDLSGAVLRGADLSEADLGYADLSGAVLRGADLSKADLFQTDLSETVLRDADLSEANLDLADLTGTVLTNARLTSANLSEADLSDADLSGAGLSEANLSGLDLSGLYLPGADLSGAGLSETNLSDANFEGADLSGADLSGANLSHASLSQADLARADIRTTTIKNITLNNKTSFRKSWIRTRLPDSSSNMTAHARAYENFRIKASNEGYNKLGRVLYILEKKAQTRAAFPEQFITFVGGVLSGLLTGYGVRPRQVLFSSLIVVIMTFFWFNQSGVTFDEWNYSYKFWGYELNTGSIYYSVTTFVTAPPNPPQDTGLITNVLVTVETYLGTVLTLLLGYTLTTRNRV